MAPNSLLRLRVGAIREETFKQETLKFRIVATNIRHTLSRIGTMKWIQFRRFVRLVRAKLPEFFSPGPKCCCKINCIIHLSSTCYRAVYNGNALVCWRESITSYTWVIGTSHFRNALIENKNAKFIPTPWCLSPVKATRSRHINFHKAD